ncbi:hypothetical protein [Desulfovibrio sp. TomC]|uniref:hypothetical protein n=1 Tax=Desulfovibrio sp. TomC TaxID=1562888 RepID=UPI0005BBC4A6|nr:hypothetical protein [Desulfovibrio sp. TomC]
MKRYTLASDTESTGDKGMREDQEGAWVRYEEAMAEISRLRKALNPILRHAGGDDKQPPLRLNIEETRLIRKEVNHSPH